jgi:hypothetical protein
LVLGVGDADLPCQQFGIAEWNEAPPKTEPAKGDTPPLGHMGLGLELDVDDAADAVAVKVHNDTSLPVEPVVGGGHSGSFRPLTHGTTPGTAWSCHS